MKETIRRYVPEPLLYRWRNFRLRGLPPHYRVAAPNSLVTLLNLMFLDNLVSRVDRAGVPGDLVECGVYRGGSAAALGATMMQQPESGRTLWLFDAFQGMPKAGPRDDALSHEIAGQYVGSEWMTRRVLARVGVPESRYKLVTGWFEETLPGPGPDSVALLHVDCDFYDPVRLVLETYYPRISPGGFVVLNDYGAFEGCRAATDEYLERIGASEKPTMIDLAAAFLQKPSP